MGEILPIERKSCPATLTVWAGAASGRGQLLPPDRTHHLLIHSERLARTVRAASLILIMIDMLSSNIIEASVIALTDSIEFMLLGETEGWR